MKLLSLLHSYVFVLALLLFLMSHSNARIINSNIHRTLVVNRTYIIPVKNTFNVGVKNSTSYNGEYLLLSNESVIIFEFQIDKFINDSYFGRERTVISGVENTTVISSKLYLHCVHTDHDNTRTSLNGTIYVGQTNYSNFRREDLSSTPTREINIICGEDSKREIILNLQTEFTNWFDINATRNKYVFLALKDNPGSFCLGSPENETENLMPKIIAVLQDTISHSNVCSSDSFQCIDDSCVKLDKVCDFVPDCFHGNDEEFCESAPKNSRCNFDDDWCGWYNITADGNQNSFKWTRHSGPTPTSRTGPSVDHTLGNENGFYMYIETSTVIPGSKATLRSPTFPPPPNATAIQTMAAYGSCKVIFSYHMYGTNIAGLELFAIQETGDVSSKLFAQHTNEGNTWKTAVISITKEFTKSFYLQFEARRGSSYRGDTAIDDVILSPACFGFDVVQENEHLLKTLTTKDYPVFKVAQLAEITTEINPVSVTKTRNVATTQAITASYSSNVTRFVLTTCGKIGYDGPTQGQCDIAYFGTNVQVQVTNGYQQWTVPKTTYYKITVKGAGGGSGAENPGPSKGATVTAVFNLTAGDQLVVVVGQKGRSACTNSEHFSGVQDSCQGRLSDSARLRFGAFAAGGGGAGGGGTFVALKRHPSSRERRGLGYEDVVPLVVASGGGGLSFSPSHGKSNFMGKYGRQGDGSNGQHGTDLNNIPGAGGGWNGTRASTSNGMSFISGSLGGIECKRAYDEMQWKLPGGFGGGGGGCTAGGGGGGYTGGNASEEDGFIGNGFGGTSFVAFLSLYSEGTGGSNQGPGEVVIEEVISCSGDLFIIIDQECAPTFPRTTLFIIVALISLVFVLILLLIPILISYKRLSRSKNDDEDRLRSELAILRQNILSEANPLYLSKASSVSEDDLLELERDRIKLLHLLGSGAFGEVYKGSYDCPETKKTIDVAIKTLSKSSCENDHNDFLIEALLLSSLNHRNVMKFVGVSFIKLPRLLVVEFLGGGELKLFLRNNRPSPGKPSLLQMSDLLRTGIDVAAGCEYLESVRFVHRDIAARNVLLSCKGLNRVCKIGDFGMARDIYKADYYRKNKQTLLPVKWMPPEAYLDGIFTHKSDVWSYGVLLWELFSFGFVPYPGLTNHEVMQCVSRGQRMTPPNYCHVLVQDLIMSCWRQDPSMRPSFPILLKDISHLGQMKEVLCTPIPLKAIELDRSLVLDQSLSNPIIPDDLSAKGEEAQCCMPTNEDIPTDSEGYLQSDTSPIQRHKSRSKKRPFLPVFMQQKSISNVYSDTSEHTTSPSVYVSDQIKFEKSDPQERDAMLPKMFSSESNGFSPTIPPLSPYRSALLSKSGTSYDGDAESDVRESEV